MDAEQQLGRGRWEQVWISGPSMVPTLRHGDRVLLHRTTRIRPGQVVMGAFLSRPDLLVVKRAVRRVAEGWWLESDNEAVLDDSRRYGPARVFGTVPARCWPLRRIAILSRRDLASAE